MITTDRTMVFNSMFYSKYNKKKHIAFCYGPVINLITRSTMAGSAVPVYTALVVQECRIYW